MLAVERRRPVMEDVFAATIDELIDRSHGRIRADVCRARQAHRAGIDLPCR